MANDIAGVDGVERAQAVGAILIGKTTSAPRPPQVPGRGRAAGRTAGRASRSPTIIPTADNALRREVEAHVVRWAVACRSSAVAEYKPVPHEIIGRGKLIIQSACRIRRLSMPI
jgi:hypothetical protein